MRAGCATFRRSLGHPQDTTLKSHSPRHRIYACRQVSGHMHGRRPQRTRYPPVGADWPKLTADTMHAYIQVCVMPWEYFEKKQDNLPWHTIHDCKTIIMPGGHSAGPEPVLGCKVSGHVERDGFVSFPRPLASAQAITPHEATAPGGLLLPHIFFPNTEGRSGEALLGGKRPLVVMVVRAVNAHTGRPLAVIRPAASSLFEVATRRTKSNDKAYVPSMDQHVRAPPSPQRVPAFAPCPVDCTCRV